eukprot:m.341949 g.341949  ORF g.341949 m.341949 type:complete len:353 (+) comp20711_c0_seq1:157-1215(+)
MAGKKKRTAAMVTSAAKKRRADDENEAGENTEQPPPPTQTATRRRGSKALVATPVPLDATASSGEKDGPPAPELTRLMGRKSFSDIWAGLLPTDNEGLRAIAAAAYRQDQQDQRAFQAQQAAQIQAAAAAAAVAVANANAQQNRSNGGNTMSDAELAAKAAKAAATQIQQMHAQQQALANEAAHEQRGHHPFQNAMNMILQQYQPGIHPPPHHQGSPPPANAMFGRKAPDDADDKRRKRLDKNREAAKECRKKKKMYVQDLEKRVSLLETRADELLHDLKKVHEYLPADKKARVRERIESKYIYDVMSGKTFANKSAERSGFVQPTPTPPAGKSATGSTEEQPPPPPGSTVH